MVRSKIELMTNAVFYEVPKVAGNISKSKCLWFLVLNEWGTGHVRRQFILEDLVYQ